MYHEIGTASDLMKALAKKGVVGYAAECVRRETAKFRQDARVRRVQEVAREWANTMSDERSVMIDFYAMMLCELDIAGIGGMAGGASGDGTLRVPAFRRLGKGRKHATDGGAWSAAIREAGNNMLGRYVSRSWIAHMEPEPMLGMAFGDGPGEACEGTVYLTLEHLTAQKLTPWALTVARMGLRAALGYPSSFNMAGEVCQYWAGEVEAPVLGALVNELGLQCGG